MSAYDNKGEEKTPRTPEKKEKSCDSYVRMYECVKHFLHSTYERACTAQDTAVNKMIEIAEIYNYKREEIRAINWNIRVHIDSSYK